MTYVLIHDKRVPYQDIDAGDLFETLDGTCVALMTEYSNKAYIVSTGETYCAAEQNPIVWRLKLRYDPMRKDTF